jgi:molybdopterin-guanine dinucleotide biosynthesis protein A
VEEHPPGGGPVAALAAGLGLVRSDLVVVAAVDHPLVTSEDISRLVASVDVDGAVAVSADGRPQPLLAAYRLPALNSALTRLPAVQGARVGELVSTLVLARVDLGPSARDCDTWADVEAVREGRD